MRLLEHGARQRHCSRRADGETRARRRYRPGGVGYVLKPLHNSPAWLLLCLVDRPDRPSQRRAMDKSRQPRTEFAPSAAASPRAATTPARVGDGAADRAPKLGEILVAQGKITPQQLAIALERQRTSGRRLGEELIKAGYVQRAVVSRALRIQRRIVFGALTTLAASTI